MEIGLKIFNDNNINFINIIICTLKQIIIEPEVLFKNKYIQIDLKVGRQGLVYNLP